MAGEENKPADETAELDMVIAEFIDAVDAGDSPHPKDWLARYPHLKADLEGFFAAQNRVNHWLRPPELITTGPFLPPTEEYHRSGSSKAGAGLGSRHAAQVTREPIGIGTLVANRYRVFDVKSGGMGRVYLAEDIEPQRHGIGRNVAIKTVVDFDEWYERRRARRGATNECMYANLLIRFEREALAWVRLGPHENIIFAWWVFEVGAKPYLLMEYADGGSLAGWIKEGRLTVPLAVNLALQFCEGMKYAVRTAGIVHRDIKPANILIKGDGILKIADFGLSKAFDIRLDRQETSKPTDSGEPLSLAGAGTPAYMAPEQFESIANADTRSDIFSFGVTLFEMLTSERLFASKNAYEMARTRAPLPQAHEIRPEVPEALSAVVARCVEYDPGRRYASFDDLSAALSKVDESLSSRRPIPEDSDTIPEALFTPSIQALGETYSLISLGRNQDAVRCAQRGLEADPDNYEHWVNKGTALSELEDITAARHCFLRATELCPSDARSWTNLGWAELGLGDPAAGLAAAEQAIRLDDRLGEAWMGHGCCQWALGRQQDAIHSLELAVEWEPHNWKTHFNLGKCLGQVGRVDEALASVRRALEINPQDAACWGVLVCIHGAEGSWNDATAAVDTALRLHPNDASLLALRAWVLWSNGGDRSAAQACLAEALELEPENEQAQLIRRVMETDETGEEISLPTAHKPTSHVRSAALNVFEEVGGATDGTGANEESQWECDVQTEWARIESTVSDVGSFGRVDTDEQRRVAIRALPRNDQGVRLFQAGEVDKAIDCYGVALREKPDYARAHDNLATALALKAVETDNWELLTEARSHYEAAIQAWPEFELARENLRALERYL